MSPNDDLTPEKRRFLLQIGEAGIVAFNPREDEVLASLMDAGLIAAKRIDAETALLRLTPEGQTVAARLRENLG